MMITDDREKGSFAAEFLEPRPREVDFIVRWQVGSREVEGRRELVKLGQVILRNIDPYKVNGRLLNVMQETDL